MCTKDEGRSAGLWAMYIAGAVLCCLIWGHAQGQTIFFEDFEDGIADGFTQLSGNWQVVNGEYYCRTEGPSVLAATAAGTSDWEDYVFECDVRVFPVS
jgi:hypothetical protein